MTLVVALILGEHTFEFGIKCLILCNAKQYCIPVRGLEKKW